MTTESAHVCINCGSRRHRAKDGRCRECELAACPNAAEHTPGPPSFVAWHEWAEEMTKTHQQAVCPGCGLWAIWVPLEVQR